MKKIITMLCIMLCLLCPSASVFADSPATQPRNERYNMARIIYTMPYEMAITYYEGDPIPPDSKYISIFLRYDSYGNPIYASGTVYKYGTVYDGTLRRALYRGTLEYWDN